jgi:hypothetical protein
LADQSQKTFDVAATLRMLKRRGSGGLAKRLPSGIVRQRQKLRGICEMLMISRSANPLQFWIGRHQAFNGKIDLWERFPSHFENIPALDRHALEMWSDQGLVLGA